MFSREPLWDVDLMKEPPLIVNIENSEEEIKNIDCRTLVQRTEKFETKIFDISQYWNSESLKTTNQTILKYKEVLLPPNG